MVEPELAYATIDDLMVLAEEFLSFLVERVLTRRALDLKVLARDTARLEAVSPLPPDHLRPGRQYAERCFFARLARTEI